MKIKVFGAGYVGLSNAVMLASKHAVEVIDIDKEKVKLLKSGISPFKDKSINKFIKKNKINLTYSSHFPNNLSNSKVIIICTPTNFEDELGHFDTKTIEGILRKLKKSNYKNLVVIRSTVPIGFTKKMQARFKEFEIAFFPEFLREGSALHDLHYPSRIICGSKSTKAKKFMGTLRDASLKKNIHCIVTSSSEAESIKLFSNTYLAMRVAFFNELDTFSKINNLNTKEIIEGVSLDSRIGNFYNNPSFGYGGYCLPKDSKQLKSNFKNAPQEIIKSVINSNNKRKKFIAEEILSKNIKNIGIYRLSMKSGSDNWRESAIIDVLMMLKGPNRRIIIFDPDYYQNKFRGFKVEKNFDAFVKESEIIIANRLDKRVEGIRKVFSRDIFKEN